MAGPREICLLRISKVLHMMLTLIVLRGRDFTPCICFDILISKKVFIMTKAVSNREICFIKAVLLQCKHGHFTKKKSKMVFFTPPILLGLGKYIWKEWYHIYQNLIVQLLCLNFSYPVFAFRLIPSFFCPQLPSPKPRYIEIGAQRGNPLFILPSASFS